MEDAALDWMNTTMVIHRDRLEPCTMALTWKTGEWVVWLKGNHLALVTIAQAAGGSDEGPLVEFDLPALDSMLSGLVWFEGRMKFRNDSKKSRCAVLRLRWVLV